MVRARRLKAVEGEKAAAGRSHGRPLSLRPAQALPGPVSAARPGTHFIRLYVQPRSLRGLW
ncbi:MAG: hypothetical protein DBY17_05785 [Oscillospiraceae bacterium]|nr:MAG: hypothetical protein DBY17_05785 [Oscillospiraceae bacterium]